jgi:hypothetical protein
MSEPEWEKRVTVYSVILTAGNPDGVEFYITNEIGRFGAGRIEEAAGEIFEWVEKQLQALDLLATHADAKLHAEAVVIARAAGRIH